MSRTFVFDTENLNEGFQKREDTTKAPVGAARIMVNSQVTDRGGIGPREGVTLIGNKSSDTKPGRSLFSYRTAYDDIKFLVRNHDQKIEVFSFDYEDQGWQILKDGLSDDKEFGFTSVTFTEHDKSYLIGGNQYDNYLVWDGASTQLNGALSGGESNLTVDSILTSDVYVSETATSNTSTSFTVSGVGWGTDSFVGLYVYVPSTGEVRRITENTYETITFDSLSAAPGNVAFEVRKLKFTFAKLNDTTIAFNDSNPDTITDSASRFVLRGFKKGMQINVSGSSSNDGNYTIASVSAGTLTLIADNSLSNEASGNNVTINEKPSVIYNGTEIEYDEPDVVDKIPVSSAHAAPDRTPVFKSVDFIPDNPKGNRFTVLQHRAVVGNVRSGKGFDENDDTRALTVSSAVFFSEIVDPLSFAFSLPRKATEGAVVNVPWGAGNITDVSVLEDKAYVFKNDYITSMSFTQTSDDNGNLDLIVEEPVKQDIGSPGRVIKGSDDIYFMTNDKRFTSIGRVAQKDIEPQTLNLGSSIKRFLDDVTVDGIGQGIEYKNKILIPLKFKEPEEFNNTVLVYDKDRQIFEGIWNLYVNAFESQDENLFLIESTTPNVYQAFNGIQTDIIGDDRFAISSKFATHFHNLTGSKSYVQQMNGLYVEGYAAIGTEVTFNIWKDHEEVPFRSFVCVFDEDLLKGTGTVGNYRGKYFRGEAPLGALAVGDEVDGLFPFWFKVYFPWEYGRLFSVGHESYGVNYQYEIVRYGLMIKEDTIENADRVKKI